MRTYGTLCADCGRRWTGRAEAHCSECHLHFGSPSAFDKHFDRNRHIQPHELIVVNPKTGRPRLVPQQRKTGVTWVEALRSPDSMQQVLGLATEKEIDSVTDVAPEI